MFVLTVFVLLELSLTVERHIQEVRHVHELCRQLKPPKKSMQRNPAKMKWVYSRKSRKSDFL